MARKADPVYAALLCKRMIRVVDYLIRNHPDVLNVTQVLEQMGSATVAYNRWQKGLNPPSGEHLLYMVEHYKVSPDFLLTGKGEIIPSHLLPQTGLNGMGKRFKVVKRKRRSSAELHGKKTVKAKAKQV